MRLINFNFIFLLILISCYGCATTFEPYEPPKITFEKTKEFKVGFEKLEEESKKIGNVDLVFIKLNEKTNEIELVLNEEDATHILLVPDELNKITAKLEIGSQYKEIAISEEALINTYINQINALKEFVELERTKSLVYRELWVNSENAYREERKDRKFDNFTSKVTTFLLGGIAILAIAL